MSYILIYVFFLCLNIGLATVESVVGVDLGAIDLPDTQDLSEKIRQPQGDDGILDFLTQGVEQAGASAKLIIDALSGGFVLNVIDNAVIDLPDTLTTGVRALLLFLLAVQVYYLFSGRIMSKLS